MDMNLTDEQRHEIVMMILKNKDKINNLEQEVKNILALYDTINNLIVKETEEQYPDDYVGAMA